MILRSIENVHTWLMPVTNKYENKSYSIGRSELNEVDHVQFPDLAGTFKN
jgi:hypothetical protein